MWGDADVNNRVSSRLVSLDFGALTCLPAFVLFQNHNFLQQQHSGRASFSSPLLSFKTLLSFLKTNTVGSHHNGASYQWRRSR
jgi:hypothetical protein